MRAWDSMFDTSVGHFGTLDHHLGHPESPRGGQEVTLGRRYRFLMMTESAPERWTLFQGEANCEGGFGGNRS